MELFERDAELVRINELLAAASAGLGAVLLVEGAAGIGKTALLAAAGKSAADRGFRVLTAVGGELEQELPFGILRQLFEPALADARPGVRADAAQLAAPVFAVAGADSREAAAGNVVHGLYWLCSNLAESAPLLLVIDDAHWSDEASMRFVSHLARRIRDLPTLLLLASRPPTPNCALTRALDGVDPELLALRPLGEDAVRRFVRERMSAAAEDEFCRACAHASGGNPFLLSEAISALTAERVLPVAAEADRVAGLAPERISRSVLDRLTRLGTEPLRLARALAVLGPSADVRRPALLAGLDQTVAAELVELLARESILSDDHPLRFTHPLVRTAVYADGTQTRRSGDHRRAAQILAAEGAPAEQLVPHLLAAAPAADPDVVATLQRAAGQALAKGAPETAAICLRRAIAEPPAVADQPLLHAELGRALGMANRPAEAAQAIRTAFDLTQDPVTRGELALDLGAFMVQTGRPIQARETFELARAAVSDGELSLRLTVAFAMVSIVTMQPPDTWIERLDRLAPTVPDDTDAGRMVLGCLAFGASATGDRPAAAVGDLAARAARGPLPARDQWMLVNFASTALVMADRLPEAIDVLDRGIEYARAHGNLAEFRYLAVLRSRTAFTAGNLLDAEADGQAALALHKFDGDGDRELPLAAAVLVDALIEQGRLDQAQAILTEHDLDERREMGMLIGHFVHMARGRLRFQQGRPRDALSDLLACGDSLVKAGCVNPGFAHWRAEAAMAYLALGEQGAARDLAEEELTLARRFGAPRATGIALRTLGLIESGGDAGLRHLAESVDVLRASTGRLELAYSLIAYGRALRRAGHRVDAQLHLRQGLDLAAQHHARPLESQAKDELIATGARPRRTALTGVDALTASELRVARLAAAGESNRVIAQTLFVSRRTVEVHLTSVYRKLGIQSREQLAAALVL